jgi:hypothetical protein
MADENDLVRLLRTRREGRALELKQTMTWADPATKGKVIRAALGMTNLRDGGVLAFGLPQKPGEPLHDMAGMGQADYESFTQDTVSSTVNTHATPHIDLSVEHLTIDEKRFVSIVFRQFADYPVICLKDFVVENKAIATKGRLYCRSKRTPETTEVQTPEDMREIIDLATSRGLERYFSLREIERSAEAPKARELFDKQLGDL